MQELEKILEEIEQRIEKAKKIIVEHPSDKMDEIANDTAEAFIEAYKECQDIIRKHMNDSKCGNCSRRKWYQIGYKDRKNDGWIPVEERLPEEGGTYIINAKDGEREIISFAKWQNRYKRFDMTGARAYWRIIAWRPLPEPYRPEQPETCKYTGGSCCWPIDQCSDCSNHPERGERE